MQSELFYVRTCRYGSAHDKKHGETVAPAVTCLEVSKLNESNDSTRLVATCMKRTVYWLIVHLIPHGPVNSFTRFGWSIQVHRFQSRQFREAFAEFPLLWYRPCADAE